MAKENCCYLCGGKLNGTYCPACGFDTSKKNKVRYRLNESNASRRLDADDDEKLKRQMKRKERQHQRLHNDFKGAMHVLSSELQSTGQAGKEKTSTYRAHNTMQSKVFGGNKVVGIVVIIIVVMVILVGVLANITDDSWNDDSWEDSSYEDTEYDPYEYVTSELSETGESYEAELTAGEYVAGTHLPEGKYTVRLLEGSGSMDVEDSENGIYLYEWFEEDADYDAVTEMEDVRLFQGAKVSVGEGMTLLFVTENGQTEQMSSIQNPLTASVEMKQGNVYESGVDFEPGVYDIRDISDYGILYHTYPNPYYYDETDDEYYECSHYLDESPGSVAYKNIVLPKGTCIWSDDADFVLTPSPEIGTIDYETYYAY